MSKTPDAEILDYARTIEESKNFNGALGVMTFAIAKGLRRGGAKEKEVASVVGLLKKYFPFLSDGDCNTLSRVVYERMTMEKDANGGRWY